MNRKTNQSGFAHIGIIAIILTVALIGALGFIYYQNFIEKKSGDTVKNEASTSSTPSTTTTTSTEDSNKGYLLLSDWDIKYKLPTNLNNNQITYKKGTYGDWEAYLLSTSEVEKLNGCSLDSSNPIPLASVTRSTSATVETGAGEATGKKVGNYYYFVWGSQSACSESSTDLQISDRGIVVDMLNQGPVSIQ